MSMAYSNYFSVGKYFPFAEIVRFKKRRAASTRFICKYAIFLSCISAHIWYNSIRTCASVAQW